MKTIVSTLVLAVIVCVTMSSPLKEKINNEKENIEQDAAFQEITENTQGNSKLGDDCYEADCNVSCWEQGHIGGRCILVRHESVCECY